MKTRHTHRSSCLSLFLLATLSPASAAPLILGDTSGDPRGADAIDIQTDRWGDPTHVASGNNAIAIGSGIKATAEKAIGVGHGNYVGGTGSAAFGCYNSVYGEFGSTAIGLENSIAASGWGFLLGWENAISPNGFGTAIGFQNRIYGGDAGNFLPVFAAGINNTINSGALNSLAFGKSNTISASDATVFGSGITNSTAGSTMIGPSDAAKVTILSSGNVGIGTGDTAPTEKLHVAGNLKVTGNIINPTLTGTVQLPSSLTVSGNAVTFPTGGGTVVTAAGTQTLTNKSINVSQLTGTLPVARGGTGATTLTGILKGNGTGAVTAVAPPAGALVGTTATQILSNKTFTGPVQVNGDVVVSGRLATGGGSATGVNAVSILGGSAQGDYSVAIGPDSAASGDSSITLGQWSYAIGYSSLAATFGVATGDLSTAFASGYAEGYHSVAMIEGRAVGSDTLSVGKGTEAHGAGQIVLGRYNVTQGNSAAWIATDDLFIVGNGSSHTARSNALVVKKNGDTSIYGNLTVSNGAEIAGDIKIQNRAVVRVSAAGDIGMGDFTSGIDPEL